MDRHTAAVTIQACVPMNVRSRDSSLRLSQIISRTSVTHLSTEVRELARHR
jgi:hypothetical protein